MPGNQIDLTNLFSQVTEQLSKHKTQLNKADDYNHNHGDNMVDIFRVITQAMEEKQNGSPADQLEYAAKLLRGQESGSALLYSKGLKQAAKEFKGKSLTTGNALQLIQSLLSGGEAAPSKLESGNPLASLVSNMLADQGPSGEDEELDLGDLMNAGMAFLSAKERGDSNAEALVDALVSNSAMGSSSHRSQSSQVVMNTIMDLVGSLGR
jgi:hypothetical protein